MKKSFSCCPLTQFLARKQCLICAYFSPDSDEKTFSLGNWEYYETHILPRLTLVSERLFSSIDEVFCLQGFRWTAVLGAGVILLFSSRACYNLAVLFLSQNHKIEAFDYDWYNISDQVGSWLLMKRWSCHWSVCDVRCCF